MSSTKNVIETGGSDAIYSVAFHPDGVHLLSGSRNGIRRWRVADGQEVGMHLRMHFNAISVSRDGEQMVCGTTRGASVWDAKIQKRPKVEVDGACGVNAVDISPGDATRFATSTTEGDLCIRDTITGKRLFRPLQHGGYIDGIKFSPNGERIATACEDSIRVFNSRNGDQLITIEVGAQISSRSITTPLAWSNDGQKIFTAASDTKIRSFDVSTGTQQAESHIHSCGELPSIALAANGKFLVTFADSSVAFWDTSTLTRIGPVVEDSGNIRSIALSPDSSNLATGGYDGNMTIRNLNDILPDTYGPFHEHESETPQDGPQDEPSQTSGVHDNKASDSNPEQPTTSDPPESDTGSENNLLEVELPSSVPVPLFDYDEPPSPVSAHIREFQPTVLGPSGAVSQLPDALPITEAHLEEHCDNAEFFWGIPTVKKWVQMMTKRSDENQGSYKRGRLPWKDGRSANSRPRPKFQEKGNSAHERPSWMAAAQLQKRTVARSVEQPTTDTKTNKADHRNKDMSIRGQGHVEKPDPGQGNSTSQPSAERVHVTRGPGDGTVWVSFKLPAWMCCTSTGAEDGTH